METIAHSIEIRVPAVLEKAGRFLGGLLSQMHYEILPCQSNHWKGAEEMLEFKQQELDFNGTEIPS